jgi:ATP-dependent RNA helicase DeaD
MPGFDELGLSTAIVENAIEQGFDAPSALQRSVIPVIRRGGNAIVRASSGSGITAAYAMALVDRLSSGDAKNGLVVVPTTDRAERVAGTIARFAQGSPVRVTALTSAWSRTGNFNVTVASAEKVLSAVGESQLSLETFDVVIVDGAAAIEKLSAKSLETLFSTLPRDSQRVFISNELNDDTRKFAEAHARKALYFPPRPADAGGQAEGRSGDQGSGTIRYAVGSGDHKIDVIARLASSLTTPITLVARSAAAAKRAARELTGRGFEVEGVTYDGFDRAEARGTVFGYDAPFSAELVTESFRDGDVVICERSELPHLKSVAQDANLKLQSASMPSYESDSLQAFRNEIRRAAQEEDLEAQMLVLEPLFSELSAEEIAAAAAALLRARRPVKAASTTGAPKGVKTFARLFLSIGERDGLQARELVGAITGESGIRGDDVGQVDIRDTFSVVEVASGAADQVIRALNGTTMKNRALRVDYDRKTVGAKGRKEDDRPRGEGRKGGGSRGGPSRGGPSRGGPSRGGPGRGGPGNKRAAR